MAGEHRPQGSTRNDILHLLRRNGEMTASELSTALGIGAVGIRQHLVSICAEGLIQPVGVRRGLGRPSRLYALTEQATRLFPQAYDTIALAALRGLAALGGQEQVEQLFDERRAELVRQYAAQLHGATLPERVAALAELLNEQGYMCEWEQCEDGELVLSEHNCPVDCVARAFPCVCTSEQRLYEQLLGVPLIQVSTIAAGATSCRYRIVAEAAP